MKNTVDIKVYPSIGDAYIISLPITPNRLDLSDEELENKINLFLTDHAKLVEEWEFVEQTPTESPNKAAAFSLTTEPQLQFWDYAYYEKDPLAFVYLGEIPPKSIVRLLALFDEWYGNTDQDTEAWALEYQILTRMLVQENMLAVNLKFLDLSEPVCLAAIEDILTSAGALRLDGGESVYSATRKLSKEQLAQAYSENN